jgi:hypothetical protein
MAMKVSRGRLRETSGFSDKNRGIEYPTQEDKGLSNIFIGNGKE